jgi:hypothetical protein
MNFGHMIKIGAYMRKPFFLTSLTFATMIAMSSFGAIASSTQSYTQEGSYCAAIRGNGPKVPSHWGSMARLTERYGMPSAMAGGSSASITMFLLESISINKMVSTDVERALLIKSIEGYMETLSKTKEGKALIKLFTDKANIMALAQKLISTGGVPADNATKAEVMALQAKHMKEVQILLESSDLNELLNPEIKKYIKDAIGLKQKYDNTSDEVIKSALEQQMNYRQLQIKYAFENFGNFNTVTDNTLFFRPGLIDFEKFAKLFGRMADFYAGYDLGRNNEVKKKVDGLIHTFIKACGTNSEGKSWQQIAVKKINISPTVEYTCRQILGKAVLDYRTESKIQEAKGLKINSRINDKIGKYISTFPTTSVIVGKAVTKYKKFHKDYLKATNDDIGKEFNLKYNQIKYGYWGNSPELRIIKRNLENKNGFIDGRGESINLSQDRKSQKFKSLGESSWLSALSTSPAEPGLARLLPIKDTNGKTIKNIISAGGWDDLHPTLVLRAVGCKNIVYVTRRGGDSMFGQGVIEKFTKIDGFDWDEWKGLSASQKKLKNAKGDISDLDSDWSKLYNLSNPDSSFSKSIELADSVWCTNWDDPKLKKGLKKLVKDGYDAPLYNRSNDFFAEGKDNRLKSKRYNKITKKNRIKTPYKYSGCLPNQ